MSSQTMTASSGLPRKTFGSRLRSGTALAYLMNLPMILLLLAIVAFPVGYSLWISFQSYNLRRPQSIRFIGLGNYIFVLTSEEFWHTLQTTLIFTVGAVATEICVGMLLALLLNESFYGRGILRSLILLPWAIPTVVGGVMWQWFFNPRFGAFDGLLYSLGLVHTYPDFFLNTITAMLILIFAQVWNACPFTTLVLLAALQSVPQDMYEAARVDGAGTFARFWNITGPWLLQPLLIIMIVSTMGSLRVFDLVYVLTGGGPGDATQVVSFTAYKKAFDALDFGSANAYAYILALITLGFGLIYVKFLYSRGEIEQ
ncbi:MAG TPA: sugar ABC transporter permease [Chloroflexota bacterium]|nr:sugar ABC transporter permease [Chloroflexota bacterium]